MEQKAKRSKSLLENEWFVKTMQDLREQQMSIFISKQRPYGSEKREEAHSMICALNAIERELQSHIDTLTLFTKKGKHRVYD